MIKSVTNWILLLFLMLGVVMMAQSIANEPVGEETPPKSNSESAVNPDSSADIPSIGSIDTPIAVTVSDPVSSIQGWALDMDGVAKVMLRIDGKKEIDISYGLTRNDVAQIHPGYPDANKAGFSWQHDLSKYLAAHSQIDVIVVDNNDVETVIGSRFVVMSDMIESVAGIV